jgi:hypothetical protein
MLDSPIIHEFQEPEIEVLYHIKPYVGGIVPYIRLT